MTTLLVATIRAAGEGLIKIDAELVAIAEKDARKLAGVLWAMWRDGTVYDASFAAQESAKGLRRDVQKRDLVASAMARAATKIPSGTMIAGGVEARANRPSVGFSHAVPQIATRSASRVPYCVGGRSTSYDGPPEREESIDR